MNGTTPTRLVRPPRYFTCAVTLELDQARCTGCGMCLEVCPHGVFSLEGRRAVIADRERCMECGACAKNCPTGAIKAGSGVGCAAAIIGGMLRGGAPECGCGSSGSSPCCGPSDSGKKSGCCG